MQQHSKTAMSTSKTFFLFMKLHIQFCYFRYQGKHLDSNVKVFPKKIAKVFPDSNVTLFQGNNVLKCPDKSVTQFPGNKRLKPAPTFLDNNVIMYHNSNAELFQSMNPSHNIKCSFY